nr:hypothetical protein CFP56_04623 [Quercus suber]
MTERSSSVFPWSQCPACPCPSSGAAMATRGGICMYSCHMTRVVATEWPDSQELLGISVSTRLQGNVADRRRLARTFRESAVSL